VNLEVSEGEFLALLGANGAGKTTILKIIATLLLPDAGSVSVLGHDALKHGRQVRAQMGYVLADERSFHWRLTVRENLEFFAGLNRLDGGPARARIDHLLSRLDLLEVEASSFSALSTGMKQRLAVARALLPRPRVLLMDEPTRSVDVANASHVWQLVREEMADANGCVILVTHNVQEALGLCDRLAILSEGQIVVDTPAHRLNALAADLDGFSLAVRGLTPTALASLSRFPGIRDIRIASQLKGEQTLDVWTEDGDLPLASFISELTSLGATLCSLRRATSLQGVLERLLGAHDLAGPQPEKVLV
jgi:ABC-2 type transport system ATP-binding protein